MKDVKNMEDKAVVLKYVKDNLAPHISGKGRNEVASYIKNIARKNGIKIVEDTMLVETLYKIDIDSFIPEECYQIVAKILIEIMKEESSEF